MSASQSQDPLTSLLRAVAAEDERLNASPSIEASLLAEVDAIGWRRRRRSRVIGLAAAAALALAAAVPAWRATFGSAPGAPPAIQAADEANREFSTEFFPLVYSNVPAADGRMVRLLVPRTALASFGASSFDAPNDRSTTVLADVVVGADGLARAVRFVHVVGTNEP